MNKFAYDQVKASTSVCSFLKRRCFDAIEDERQRSDF